MEIALAGTGVPLEAARRAAREGRLAAAAGWARWTLETDAPPEPGSFARALAWRLLTRGTLMPPAPELEEGLARFGPRAADAASALHRLQAAAVLAAPAGLPSRLESDLHRAKLFSCEEARWIEESALRDLGELLGLLRRIYPETADEPREPLFVSWLGTNKAGWRNAAIGVGHGGQVFDLRVASPAFNDDLALEALARRLRLAPSLRPGQAEGAAALLSGRDLVMSLATGGGKSLAFQLAALLSSGTALVVAPLRALLRDQARRLAEIGVDRVGLLCGDDPESTAKGLAELAAGRLILCLAAPERLDCAAFREALRGAAEGPGVPFAVVDEFHCAARRGHDWRPAYRALGARLRDWAGSSGRAPALAALSGSTSPGALAEAERVLGLDRPARVASGGGRGNLAFRVRRDRSPDRLERLRALLTRTLPEGRFGPGIVFCPRVDGPLGAAAAAEALAWSEGIDAAAYTGRPPAGADPAAWAAARRRAADDFLAGRRGLLCATRAFGLGVDRADVHFTVHLGLPASLEEFFQQAGRAGRDGRPAECWLLLQALSERRAARWAAAPIERLRAELDALRPGERDDVARAYALHLAAFPGEETERRDADLVLSLLGDVAEPGPAEVSLPGQDEDALARALVLLEDAGVLSLEGRRGAAWLARRRGGWTPSAAREAAFARVERDYRAVEPGRRASLAELVELALAKDAGAALSARLGRDPVSGPGLRACPRRA
ncbi:MAG: ATP-dependent DNA helicase RecQ [Elusimicrobia bacterium]|nr:ATP-dependent DNA helicase RecQ [Elusimicrobiota bacterium]